MAEDTCGGGRDRQLATARAVRDWLDQHGGAVAVPVDHTVSGR